MHYVSHVMEDKAVYAIFLFPNYYLETRPHTVSMLTRNRFLLGPAILSSTPPQIKYLECQKNKFLNLMFYNRKTKNKKS